MFRVDVPLVRKKGWQWWCLVTSDRHWDSPKSDLKLQLKHLKEARERGAAIIDIGDFVDLMGGRHDPRGVKGTVRREHNVPHYFDAVIADAAEWFEPFAHNFVMIAEGNHETAMTHRHEFNSTERLVGQLNMRTGARVYNGGYSGWVVFSFNHTGTKGYNVVANYHHGTSSGKSSSNILAHERRAAYLPDPDILISGHAHNFWNESVARLRLGKTGIVYQDEQLHLGCPSYKDDIGDGSHGWAVEKGFRPKPLGAWWLRFYFEPTAHRVCYEAIKAQ